MPFTPISNGLSSELEKPGRLAFADLPDRRAQFPELARKKFRAARRLEKLRKKSALLIEDDGMTEGEKGRAVSKLLAKAAKAKPKRKVKVVVAVGNNRGISGRPKGTKGRYKMVDARMKKDMRAEKRLKKKLGKK